MKKIGKVLLTTLFMATMSAGVACTKDSNGAKFTFETNGGASIESIQVNVGENVTLPVPTAREGYEFEGWYDNAEFKGDAVTTVSVAEAVSKTYYAKWTQLCLLTLDANGGTLDQTTYYIKEGTDVNAFLQDKIPVIGTLTFGGWFDGNTEVNSATRITADGLSLKAKYKVAYTVEIFTENFTDDGYTKTDTVTAYGFIGEKNGLDVAGYTDIAGLTEVEKSDTVKQVTLKENTENNVCRRYFNRQSFELTLMSNYPDGSTDIETDITLKYGQPFNAPFDTYETEGYFLTGWAKTPSGEAIYKTDGMNVLLFNEDGEGNPDQIALDGNTTLYAVWTKAYVNLYGGSDYIYLSETNRKVAYLSRGGYFFKGYYSATKKTFEFYDSAEDTMIDGEINTDNGTYAYYDASRAKQYVLYTAESGADDTVTLTFDKAYTVTYKVIRDESKGTYLIDDDGNYVVTYKTGTLKGTQMVVATGEVDGENVFRVRNEDEFGKTYFRGVVRPDTGDLTFYNTAYEITLDGFGMAKYHSTSGTTNYYYTIDENGIMQLLDSDRQPVSAMKVYAFTLGDKDYDCYMPYDEKLDRTFETASGERLKLDGVNSATYYKANGEEVTGHYSITTSLLGGYVVTVNNTEKFRIDVATTGGSSVIGGETEEETETVYTLTKQPFNYKEYYFKDENSVYYAPLLIENDGENGKATLYGYTANKTFVKVSSGTLTKDGAGRSVYTAKHWYSSSEEILTNPIDASTIATFTYGTGESGNYTVAYWYSSLEKDADVSETVVYGSTYTNSGDTLTLNSGFVVYKTSLGTKEGTYTQKDGIVTATFANGTDTETVYFETNGNDFVLLAEQPRTVRIVETDGFFRDAYFTFDGKGGAVYTLNEETSYTGTFTEKTDKTVFGDKIFTFTSAEYTFDCTFVSLNDLEFYSIYKPDAAGVFTTTDSTVLTLDGFSTASYKDKNKVTKKGTYYITENGVICLFYEEGRNYFDLLEGGKFSVRGEEYGEYVLADNQSVKNVYFSVDGYGKATVFSFDDEDVKTVIAEDVPYTLTNDGISISFTVQSETKSYDLVFGESGYLHATKSYTYLVVRHAEVAKTYINPTTWEMLVLRDDGTGVKYTKDGAILKGKYTVITDTLLSFESNDGTDACLYEYDNEKATATGIDSYTVRGYFTTDLDAMKFTEYGFVEFGATEKAYYFIENGSVTIYRQSDELNEYGYGYQSEDFGTFTDVKTWNGNTYYQNDGFEVKFNRVEADKTNYPVAVVNGSEDKFSVDVLKFSPNGEEEFEETASVTINGRNYDAVITREKDAHDNVVTYMTVNISGGPYRFDLDVEYLGVDDHGASRSTFTITGMHKVIETPSYLYLNNYVMYYIYLGPMYALMYENEFGTITINHDYDVTGTEIGKTATGEFGTDSEIYDTNGEIISFENAPFEFDNATNVYTVIVEHTDGYTYRFCFGNVRHSAFKGNVLGYYMLYVAREETLTADGGYEVTSEVIVASDNANNKLGSFAKMSIKKNGTELPCDAIVKMGDNIYYVSRTKDGEGNVTATIYYRVAFTETSGGAVEQDEKIVPTFESVAIEEEAATVVYNAEGTSFIEIFGGKVVFYMTDGKTVLVNRCTYDEATHTYTLSVGEKTYKAVVSDDGTVLEAFEEVVEEE